MKLARKGFLFINIGYFLSLLLEYFNNKKLLYLIYLVLAFTPSFWCRVARMRKKRSIIFS